MLKVAIMMPQCIAAQRYDDQYPAVPENDRVISLITNSKILPYTVQGFCHIIAIFTKMIEQNTG